MSPTSAAADAEIEELVVAATGGEDRAWHELWQRLEPRLSRLLRNPSVFGPLARADDAVKDVLVAVMAKLRDDDFRRLRAYLEARRANPAQTFVPWVTVVAKRAAIDRMRAEPTFLDLRYQKSGPTGAWVETVELDDGTIAGTRLPITNRVTARQILRLAGDVLTVAQRRAVELWSEETPSAAIARELGLASAGEADRLVRSGVERLRRRLRKNGE